MSQTAIIQLLGKPKCPSVYPLPFGALQFYLTFCLTPSNAAQLAASIEYETIARPADVPGDLQPLPGASPVIIVD